MTDSSRKAAGGRQPNRVTPGMWVRRIVSLVVLAALLVGLIVLAVRGWGLVSGLLSDQHAKTTQATQVGPVEIGECVGEDLKLRVVPSAETVDEGAGMEVKVRLENDGKLDCTVEPGAVNVTLAMGDEDVWTPTACHPEWHPRLLLGEGQKWEGTLGWDGGVYVDCVASTYLVDTYEGQVEVQATAGSGMYTLRAEYGDGESSDKVKVEVR